MSPFALRRYRAERLLRKDFPELREKVLAVVNSRLREKGVRLDRTDLESCYLQAFHGLYATVLDGVEIENPTGWLVTVAFRRAIDESRVGARQRIGAEGRQQVAGWVGAAGDDQWAVPDADIAAAIDDRARLRQLFEGLRSSLSPRECEAASLCYLQGLTRAEAAKRMGMSETRMRKLMEGAGPGRAGLAGKMGALLSTIKEGQWCEQQSSLMRAYAFSILDPEGERYDLATAHLRECPACRAHVMSLRGLAAVLPPLPLTLLLAGGGGAATGVTVGSGTAGVTGSGSGAGTGAGWIGGMGSLTAKLAVVGMAAVGTGFALHGGGAHGSAGGSTRIVSRPSSLADDSHSRFSLLTPLGETRHRPTIHASSAHRSPRARETRPARPARKVSARSVVAPEFSPERVQSTARTSTPSQSPAAGEFGF
jgi:DNA-directed RNA polymerase specialized sigma24 family protein